MTDAIAQPAVLSQDSKMRWSRERAWKASFCKSLMPNDQSNLWIVVAAVIMVVVAAVVVMT